ncbi:hypothetical protein LUZ60_007256 [Juncus effusus]|nr:hypothetical protein LUZ60_007256 [Juncus effusus]
MPLLMPASTSSLSSNLLLLSLHPSHYQSNHFALQPNLSSRHNALMLSKPLQLCHSASDPAEFDMEEAESDEIEILEESEEIEVEAEVEKVEGEKNRRIIKAQVQIEAPLETIWAVMTNYEGLADFIPSLAVSQLLEYKDNVARLYQVGQQELALGFKFSAKGVIECYENEMEIVSPSCRRRAIDFKMVEGDFKIFKGQWSIEQVNDDFEGEFQTKLSYMVELEPKLMVPVRLIEGRLCREVKTNLLSIREEAQRLERLRNESDSFADL